MKPTWLRAALWCAFATSACAAPTPGDLDAEEAAGYCRKHPERCPDAGSPAPTPDAGAAGGLCPASPPAGYASVTSFTSLAAAAQSGQNLYFPAGTYANTANLDIRAGVKITGAGRDAVTVRGEGFDLESNVELSCLTIDGGGAGYDGISFNHVGSAASGVLLHDLRITGFQHGIFSGKMNSLTLRDSELVRNAYCWYGAARDSTFQNNRLQPGWAAGGYTAGAEFGAAVGVQLLGNTVDGGITGFKFLHSYTWMPKAGFHDVTISGNTVRGFSEEGISTDVRGNTGSATGVREIDTVAAASGTSVRLSYSGWSGSAYVNHWMVFSSGACKSRRDLITAQSGASFTLRDGTCIPSPGDEVIIGLPFFQFDIRDNTVDASHGLAGIEFWGYTFDVTVENNLVTGPDLTRSDLAAIRMSSLQGLAPDTAIVPLSCGRKAPTDGVAVRNNRIGSASAKPTDIVLVLSVNYSGCSAIYGPIRNQISGNQQPTVTRSL